MHMDSIYEPKQVYFAPAVSPSGNTAIVKSDGTILTNPNTNEEQRFTVELPPFSHMQVAWISDEELVIAAPEPALLTAINISTGTTTTHGDWNGIFVPIWGTENAILGSVEIMNRQEGTTTTKLLGYNRSTGEQKSVVEFPHQKYLSHFVGLSEEAAYIEYVSGPSDLQQHMILQISYDKTDGWKKTEHSISDTHRFVPVCSAGKHNILVAKTQLDWGGEKYIFRTEDDHQYKIYNTRDSTLTPITLNSNEEIITNYGHIRSVFTWNDTTNELHRCSVTPDGVSREETHKLAERPRAITHTKNSGIYYAKAEDGHEEAPYSHKQDKFVVPERARYDLEEYELSEHQFESEGDEYTLTLYGQETSAPSVFMTYPTANATIARESLAVNLISNGYHVAGVDVDHEKLFGTPFTIRDATGKLATLDTVEDIGLYGHSAGGTQVLYVEQTTDLENVSCVISSCPVLACTDESRYVSIDGANEEETESLVKEFSPLHRASQTITPTTLLFDKYDTTCPPYNELEYEDRMPESAETHLLPVSHVPLSIDDQATYNTAVHKILEKHLD